jgi:hypothetical protein
LFSKVDAIWPGKLLAVKEKKEEGKNNMLDSEVENIVNVARNQL